MRGLNFGGDICASGADHHGLFFTFKGQIFACSKPSMGFHRSDVHPSGAVLRQAVTGAWNLIIIVGVWGRLSGGSVAHMGAV